VEIPTVFMRDHRQGGTIVNTVRPGCEWVLAGEGQATVMLEGLVQLSGGKLYKQLDEEGSVVSDDSPEEQVYRDALTASLGAEDGEYILSNPPGARPSLVPIENVVIEAPRNFDELRRFLEDNAFKGIVFDKDGERAQVKSADYGAADIAVTNIISHETIAEISEQGSVTPLSISDSTDITPLKIEELRERPEGEQGD
jgi:hypothetical protein